MISSRLRLPVDRQECFLFVLMGTVLGLQLCTETRATTFVDAQNLIAVTVTPTPSSAAGHLAWRFEVAPVDGVNVVSSIDAATGSYGFFGEAVRQVNPNGLPTIFSDFNSLFGQGEDETTDTQFLFARSNLLLAPGSELEDGGRLEATFTGFSAIRIDSASHAFAQIVLPTESAGTFHGAFALRPTEGGLGQLVELGPISFSMALGDFDFDSDVDGADFLSWQRGMGTNFDTSDLVSWQTNFGEGDAGPLVASTQVPEPSSVVLLFGLITIMLVRCKRPPKADL